MQGDIEARVERYAELRAALRAVSGACPPGANVDLHERCRGVRALLREAARRIDRGETREADVAAIDSSLDEISSEIVARVEGLKLSQLRAELPAVRSRNPEELKALLDLFLIDESGLTRVWRLVDYLVTLLATEERAGRREIVADPVTLTPRLAEITASYSGPGCVELICAFDEARSCVERGEQVGDMLKALRRMKRVEAWRLLAPDALRAVVAYNTAVWNRLQELKEAERALDQAETRDLESFGAGAPSEPPADSLFDCPGLGAVERAIGGAVRGESGSDPASLLDERLGCGSLLGHARRAFAEAEADPAAPVVRAAVALAWVLRSARAAEAEVRRLGIDLDSARRRWAPALVERIADATQRALAEDRYDEARKLAEVRTRLTRAADGGRVPAAAGARAFAAGSAAPRRAAPARRPAARETPAPRRRAPRARTLALAGVLGLSLALWFASMVPQGNIDPYSPLELAEISDHLASAYRDSAGRTFVGTLREDWGKLPEDERAAISEEIVEYLQLRGVRAVMLIGADHRVALQWSAAPAPGDGGT